MVIKIYALKGCPHSTMILNLLDISEIKYDLVTLYLEDLSKKEFLDKNPTGAVPFIEVDDLFISQVPTILRWIARKTDKFYGNSLEDKTIIDYVIDSLASQLPSFYTKLLLPLFNEKTDEKSFQKSKLEFIAQI